MLRCLFVSASAAAAAAGSYGSSGSGSYGSTAAAAAAWYDCSYKGFRSCADNSICTNSSNYIWTTTDCARSTVDNGNCSTPKATYCGTTRGSGGSYTWTLQTSGTCAQAITSLSTCSQAAAALGLSDTTASNDGQTSVSYDPKGCYYEDNSLKYNSAQRNTGQCTTVDRCLCGSSFGSSSGSSYFSSYGSGSGGSYTSGNTGTGALRISGGAPCGAGCARGRLEVFYNGAWGTVCDDSFSWIDATVACRQMGMTGGTAYTAGGNGGSILMDNMGCVGSENRLSQCTFNGWGVNDCSMSENVGVQCTSSSSSGSSYFSSYGSSVSRRRRTYYDRRRGSSYFSSYGSSVSRRRTYYDRRRGTVATSYTRRRRVYSSRRRRRYIQCRRRYYYCPTQGPSPTPSTTPSPTPPPTIGAGVAKVVVPTQVAGLSVATFGLGAQYAYRLTLAGELPGTSASMISLANIRDARRRLGEAAPARPWATQLPALAPQRARRLAGSVSFDASISVGSSASATDTSTLKARVKAVPSSTLAAKLKANLAMVQTAGNFKDMATMEVSSMTIAVVVASEPSAGTSAPAPLVGPGSAGCNACKAMCSRDCSSGQTCVIVWQGDEWLRQSYCRYSASPAWGAIAGVAVGIIAVVGMAAVVCRRHSRARWKRMDAQVVPQMPQAGQAATPMPMQPQMQVQTQVMQPQLQMQMQMQPQMQPQMQAVDTNGDGVADTMMPMEQARQLEAQHQQQAMEADAAHQQQLQQMEERQECTKAAEQEHEQKMALMKQQMQAQQQQMAQMMQAMQAQQQMQQAPPQMQQAQMQAQMQTQMQAQMPVAQAIAMPMPQVQIGQAVAMPQAQAVAIQAAPGYTL